MKKFAEKHDLVKIAGIMVLISVLLTWVIPQGYFSGAELNSNDITKTNKKIHESILEYLLNNEL